MAEMTPDEPKRISEEEAERLGIDEGSKLVKELAKEQRISIQLTPEQMDAILSQWAGLDNSKPAEITFEVSGRDHANLKVASYGYFSDTCCA
jgi:hypothetical protein